MFIDLVYTVLPFYHINHIHRQAESPHFVPLSICHVNSEWLLMSCRTNKQFSRESPHCDHLTIICLSVSQRPECVWIWCEEMFNLLFWGPVMMCPLLWFIRGVMTSSPGKLRKCDFLLFRLLFVRITRPEGTFSDTLRSWVCLEASKARQCRHTQGPYLACLRSHPMGTITSQTSKRCPRIASAGSVDQVLSCNICTTPLNLIGGFVLQAEFCRFCCFFLGWIFLLFLSYWKDPM